MEAIEYATELCGKGLGMRYTRHPITIITTRATLYWERIIKE
jgi:hypothetical protein